MNLPATSRNGSDIVEFFCKHLVALCATFKSRNFSQSDQALQFVAYPGTLIEIQGVIFFLTAGHILRDLETALKSEQIEIENVMLADTFGSSRVTNFPIPFDLRNACLFYIDDDEEGLDFGVIMLEPYYVRLLAANGVVALQEKNWIHQETVSFDGYAMLGLPEEFTSHSISDSNDPVVLPTMFGVRRLETLPDGATITRHPRFVGQISAKLPLKSVKGMSGGPIFGFRLEPEPRYWIVALQSSWNPTQRIVYGCSLPVLASLMTKWAAEPAAA